MIHHVVIDREYYLPSEICDYTDYAQQSWDKGISAIFSNTFAAVIEPQIHIHPPQESNSRHRDVQQTVKQDVDYVRKRKNLTIAQKTQRFYSASAGSYRYHCREQLVAEMTALTDKITAYHQNDEDSKTNPIGYYYRLQIHDYPPLTLLMNGI